MTRIWDKSGTQQQRQLLSVHSHSHRAHKDLVVQISSQSTASDKQTRAWICTSNCEQWDILAERDRRNRGERGYLGGRRENKDTEKERNEWTRNEKQLNLISCLFHIFANIIMKFRWIGVFVRYSRALLCICYCSNTENRDALYWWCCRHFHFTTFSASFVCIVCVCVRVTCVCFNVQCAFLIKFRVLKHVHVGFQVWCLVWECIGVLAFYLFFFFCVAPLRAFRVIHYYVLCV